MPIDSPKVECDGREGSELGLDEVDGHVPLRCEEWEALGDLAMAFRGVMRLIETNGFDNSTGAEELLGLVSRRYQQLIGSIQARVFQN